jgi:putative addiction module component (TIGR02574 family)
MGTVEIQKMSPSERLKTMELLWDAIIQDAESVPIPPWHEQVLKERMDKIRRGESKFLNLDEVKERLGRKP